MVSENILHSRMKYYLPFALLLVQTVAGFLLARAEYSFAILLMVSGAILAWIIVRLYDGTNKAVEMFFSALRNDDTSLSFPIQIRNKSLAELHESMNALNSHFSPSGCRMSLMRITTGPDRHSATGMVVMNSHDQVELINRLPASTRVYRVNRQIPTCLRLKSILCSPVQIKTGRILHTNR
jgi:hypothetical protein